MVLTDAAAKNAKPDPARSVGLGLTDGQGLVSVPSVLARGVSGQFSAPGSVQQTWPLLGVFCSGGV